MFHLMSYFNTFSLLKAIIPANPWAFMSFITKTDGFVNKTNLILLFIYYLILLLLYYIYYYNVYSLYLFLLLAEMLIGS